MERKARNRGKGEGSIVKRSDGRYQGSYVHNGKRHYIYGRQRNEVRDRLATILHDIRGGTYVAPDRTTVAAFMTRWLDEVKKPALRRSSYLLYARLIRNHIEPSELGRAPIQEARADQIQAFLSECARDGLAGSTVSVWYAVIRQAFKQAHRWGLTQRDVSALVEPPRYSRYQADTLSGEQARALLRATEGHRWHALLVLALGTGMRQGELLGLRWQDVDLEGGYVTVRSSLQRVGGEAHMAAPKNDRVRRIPVPPSVISVLREHRRRMAAERIQSVTGHVFTNPGGTPLWATTLRRWYKRALRSAGLPDFRFHDLRHSVATILLEAGVHPRVVMEILGHSQIAVTMNTYSHVMPHVQRDGLQKMDEVLFGS